MLALYVQFRTKEDFRCGGVGFLRLGFYKLAHHVQLQLPNQVSHKDEAVFHHADNVKVLALKISGNLAGHLQDAFLDLLSSQENPGIFRPNAAHSPASVVMIVSSIKTASPELPTKSCEGGKDRIQTICPALSITGQALRSAGESS